MRKKFYVVFEVATVFIGTIVGAGLASGQEISQFFSCYGIKSFIGILICLFIYIFIGNMIIKLSIKYSLNSYNSLIVLVSPDFLGQVIDILMSLFLICSAAIILSGSGALMHQYFGVPKWIGLIIMCIVSLLILMRDTSGIVEVNTLIVPSLIIVLATLFILFVIFNKNSININYISSIGAYKSHWFLSSILYAGFNILSCSGVLVPLSKEFKDGRSLMFGVICGAAILALLCAAINIMLLLNLPYILKYEIPLLYIANRFGKVIELMLLIIIWFEMFSTEVSDVFSIAKTVEQIFKISYKKSIFIIMLIAIPISQFGFTNLINFLYPAFGALSIIFMIRCTFFYYKNM